MTEVRAIPYTPGRHSIDGGLEMYMSDGTTREVSFEKDDLKDAQIFYDPEVKKFGLLAGGVAVYIKSGYDIGWPNQDHNRLIGKGNEFGWPASQRGPAGGDNCFPVITTSDGSLPVRRAEEKYGAGLVPRNIEIQPGPERAMIIEANLKASMGDSIFSIAGRASLDRGSGKPILAQDTTGAGPLMRVIVDGDQAREQLIAAHETLFKATKDPVAILALFKDEIKRAQQQYNLISPERAAAVIAALDASGTDSAKFADALLKMPAPAVKPRANSQDAEADQAPVQTPPRPQSGAQGQDEDQDTDPLASGPLGDFASQLDDMGVLGQLLKAILSMFNPEFAEKVAPGAAFVAAAPPTAAPPAPAPPTTAPPAKPLAATGGGVIKTSGVQSEPPASGDGDGGTRPSAVTPQDLLNALGPGAVLMDASKLPRYPVPDTNDNHMEFPNSGKVAIKAGPNGTIEIAMIGVSGEIDNRAYEKINFPPETQRAIMEGLKGVAPAPVVSNPGPAVSMTIA